MEDSASGPENPHAAIVREISHALGESRHARRGRAAHARGRLRAARLALRRALGSGPRRQEAALGRGLSHAVAALRPVCRGEPGDGVRARHRLARTGLGLPPSCLDCRRHAGRQFSSRHGRRRRRAPRRIRAADHAWRRRARRHGILQPRHPATGRRVARDDGHRGEPDRVVPGSQAGGRRTGDASSTCRSTCCASPAWTEPSFASIPRGSACSASRTRSCCASPFLDFVHPDDRAAHDRGDVGADVRRAGDQFREPLPRARRLVLVARVVAPPRSSTRA